MRVRGHEYKLRRIVRNCKICKLKFNISTHDNSCVVHIWVSCTQIIYWSMSENVNCGSALWLEFVIHYIDVIMTTMASQITSLTVVYLTVYSDADQRKHQSSASLAFVQGIHRDRWIHRTKDQLRGKCFHLMTSSWYIQLFAFFSHILNGWYNCLLNGGPFLRLCIEMTVIV